MTRVSNYLDGSPTPAWVEELRRRNDRRRRTPPSVPPTLRRSAGRRRDWLAPRRDRLAVP
jgi:hypothetical protein